MERARRNPAESCKIIKKGDVAFDAGAHSLGNSCFVITHGSGCWTGGETGWERMATASVGRKGYGVGCGTMLGLCDYLTGSKSFDDHRLKVSV